MVDMYSADECMPASFDIGRCLIAPLKCYNTLVRLCSERRSTWLLSSTCAIRLHRMTAYAQEVIEVVL